MNYGSKKLLVQCGIFTGIFCVFFSVLSLFIVLSRKNWEAGLKQSVFSVLSAEKYAAGKMVDIDEKKDMAACFELYDRNKDDRKSPSDSFVLVMRMTTYYGPVPAVFVYENNSVRFAGIAYLQSSVSTEFFQSRFDRQMSFWTARAEEIFKNAKQIQGER